MSAATKILDRLDRVKQTRPDNYIAACPCCRSRNGRPISVRSMNDGRVLVHAFCGCETADVLSGIGLKLGDLFDTALEHHLPPIRGGFNARELLELNAHEAMVAATLASDARERTLTGDEIERLSRAASRLCTAQAMAHGR